MASPLLKRIGKWLLYSLVGLFVFLFLLVNATVVALKMPRFQTWAVRKAATYLTDKTGHQVSVGQIDIKFFKTVSLHKVRVLDARKQELFYVGELDASISLFDIWHPNQLGLSKLTLHHPRASLVRYAGSETLNVTTFVEALTRLFKSDPKAPPSKFTFTLEELEIHNGHFNYDVEDAPRLTYGIDYSHLNLDSIHLQLTEIDLAGDTISGQIDDLHAWEANARYPLHELDSKVTFHRKFWEFADLNLRVGKSDLSNFIRFDYGRFSQFSQFVDSVEVKARLVKSHVYAADIAMFAPQLKDYQEDLVISGSAKGKVSNFTARDLDLVYGANTRVKGNVSLNGLPNLKETFMEVRLQPSTLNARDVRGYLPAEVYEMTARLGTVQLKGQFVGFYNDFVANGSFNTALGKLTTDINLKIDEKYKTPYYKGFLQTDGFNLGRLLGDESKISTIALKGRVAGSGFTLQDANSTVDVTVSSIRLLGYEYRNLITKGKFNDQSFTGDFSIKDPNLALAAQGSVNLKKGAEKFDFKGRLENTDLQALGFTPRKIVLSSDLNLDFQGLKLDQMLGLAELKNVKMSVDGKEVMADTLTVHSHLANGMRSLQLNSDLLNLLVEGDFQYTTLIADLKMLVNEYVLHFNSNEAKTNSYYARKTYQPTEYKVELTAELKNTNPVLHLFLPELTLSDHAKVTASFINGENSVLTLNTKIDTIQYQGNYLYHNHLDLNTSKLTHQPDVLAVGSFESSKQQFGKGAGTENFYAEGVWTNRKIDFSTHLAQTNSSNQATITGDLAFLQNQLEIVFDKSSINLLDGTWEFAPANTIDIKGREITIRNFKLSNGRQQISAQGQLSADPAKLLTMEIKDFDMATLNAVSKQQMGGTLNAKVNLQNAYQEAIVNSELKVDNFQLDSMLIGLVQGSSRYLRSNGKVDVDFDILREGLKVVAVDGYYNPRAEGDKQLDLTAVLNNAQVKLVEPFLKVIMHDMDGTMSGKVRVTGQPTAPLLKGVAEVRNGRFNFTYLNTVYTFTDKVYFDVNGILFKSLKLNDPYGNTGTLNGGVYHDGFSNMVIDLRASFRKLLVLNTTSELNKLYYGSAVATGTASVLGAPSNLKVKVDARSEKGTRIFIPLSSSSDIARKDYIRFVSRNNPDSTALKLAVEKQKVNLDGINLDFTFDVTEDAYCEILIDERTGDIISGSGNGQIQMNIDTRGNFNMYGQFEIARGAYNFTVQGLARREFIVRRGGTITWNGDPLEGILNLSATYTRNTSLKPFMQNASNQRVPVTVVMNLKGELMAPEIGLDLEFNDIPASYEQEISAFQSQIRSNANEMTNQVFNLLVVGTLVPPGNALGNSTAGPGLTSRIGTGTLGDLVSQQLEGLVSNLDPNLDLSVNLGDFDQSRGQDVRYRVGYNIGRLQVSREGGLGGANTDQLNNTDAGLVNQSSVGDWTVNYLLSKDGRYRAKLEYQTLVNSMAGSSTNSYRTSASLQHTASFNSLADLFRRRKLRKKDLVQPPIERKLEDSDVRPDLVQ